MHHALIHIRQGNIRAVDLICWVLPFFHFKIRQVSVQYFRFCFLKLNFFSLIKINNIISDLFYNKKKKMSKAIFVLCLVLLASTSVLEACRPPGALVSIFFQNKMKIQLKFIVRFVTPRSRTKKNNKTFWSLSPKVTLLFTQRLSHCRK